MVICGVKLTHDGGLAIIDNGLLKHSIEMEKLDNNPRYSDLKDVSKIPAMLEACGYCPEQIDKFVIDGWHGEGKYWNGVSLLKVLNGKNEIRLEVAPYNEKTRKENILDRYTFNDFLPVGAKSYNYSSYMHVTGHVLSAYCTSPFAKNKQSSYVLVWDGGQYPRLYYFDAHTCTVKNLGILFLLLGTIYSIFAQYFGPYKKTSAQLQDERKTKEIEGYFGGYSVAGKIMSYIALGKSQKELFDVFSRLRKDQEEVSNEFEHLFSEKARLLINPKQYSDANVLATLHDYLEQLILEKLKEKVEKFQFPENNLCFSGGCALNIKWNSAIRNSGMFNDVYVPPFPNDSGSAIGAAAAEYLYTANESYIDWNVYSGPLIKNGNLSHGWDHTECSIAQLAFHLYTTGEPVVFLNGAAELGPRALGNRSIIAPPGNKKMKDLLNKVKKREHFRPVAPICLEEKAPEIFNPGCRDPYMLFDHTVRDEWKERVPAICHLDGSARLQTINETDNQTVYSLLQEYYKLSGLPLLCNTSANNNGQGFFPDVESATQWGQVNYIWCNNILYSKLQKNDFSDFL